MTLVIDLSALLLGFFFLARGSGWLVAGASEIAGHLGVRPLVLGLTVVAWGTSLPEVLVSGLAAVEGQAGIALGNVLGSNAANIGLVLGACSLILPGVLHKRLDSRESLWSLAALGLFWWCAKDGGFSRVDGAFLLSALLIYNLQLFWEAREAALGTKAQEPRRDTWLQRHPKYAVAIGGITLALAAQAVMVGAVGLAQRAGLSDLVIGLTVVAIGTSLPELAAGLSAALRGHGELLIGNVVGSNVFNVLGVIGIVALIHPLGGAADPKTEAMIEISLGQDLPVVLAFSLAAVFLPLLAPGRGGRAKGAVLLGGWLTYTLSLVCG
jgi:cation:H+ antiporter